MAEIKNKFSLKFTNRGNENADLNISLSWSQEGISSLCVMMFEPHNKLDRIWLIRTVDENDDWTGDKTIDTDDCPEIYVYGMTSAKDQSKNGDCFEVLISGSIRLVDVGKSIRTLTLDKHYYYRSFLMKTYDLDQFKMTRKFTRFTPPDYRLDFTEESFLGQRDVMIFLGKARTDREYVVLTKMSRYGVIVPLSLPSRNTYNGLVIELQRDLIGYKSLRTSEKFEMNTVQTRKRSASTPDDEGGETMNGQKILSSHKKLRDHINDNSHDGGSFLLQNKKLIETSSATAVSAGKPTDTKQNVTVQRKFPKAWLNEFQWLTYNSDTMTCKYCSIYWVAQCYCCKR